MENIQPQCKLCCSTIGDESFKVIDDVIKDVFEVLFQKMRFDKGSQNVVCTVCFSKVLAAFNFKSTCLNTDDAIVPYVESKAVDLKEVYGKEKGWKNENGKSKDLKICRLCFEPMDSKHRLIQDIPQGNIEIFIPEINLALTTSTAICTRCYDSVCIHSTFIKTCLESEKKSDVKETLTNFYVKMEEIEIKSEEAGEEMLVENDLKKRDNEKRYTSPCKYVTSEDCDDCLSKLGHKNTSQMLLYKYDESVCKSTQKLSQKKRKVLHKDHRSLGMQMFSCDKCTFETKNERYLSIDQLRHKDPSEMPVFKCDKCKFITRHQGSLSNHQTGHKDPSEVQMYRYNKCTCKTIHKISLELTHNDRVQMYKCDECSYKSIQKGNLLTHQLKHKNSSEVQIYSCSECDYKTIHKYRLKQHQLRHKDPSEVQTYRCDKCTFTTIHKTSLKRHQLTHSDASLVQKYSCDKCSFKTIYKGNLIAHQLKHKDPSEVQMYKCDECGYKSIHRHSLQQHQLRHKDPSEVRRYTCDKCKFTTILEKRLKRHQLTHSDASLVQKYSCDKCRFKTIYKANLLMHQLIHKDPSEVKMYKCDGCKFKTKYKSNLKNHQLTHI